MLLNHTPTNFYFLFFIFYFEIKKYLNLLWKMKPRCYFFTKKFIWFFNIKPNFDKTNFFFFNNNTRANFFFKKHKKNAACLTIGRFINNNSNFLKQRQLLLNDRYVKFIFLSIIEIFNVFLRNTACYFNKLEFLLIFFFNRKTMQLQHLRTNNKLLNINLKFL